MLAPKLSWKKTLHLPKSAFPPRARVADRPKYIKQCTDDLYRWQHDRNHPTKFILHDGPPYANGDLHIGHALNKILKDIICRYHVFNGTVDWVPGWDCHGLPIELKALQEQGKKPDRLSVIEGAKPVAIRNAARKLAMKTVEKQKQSFREWGIMADWDHAWTTMDEGFEIKQLEVFKRMVHNNLVYRRFKPVYWSPSSRTAMAEAELEYREDHVSTAVFMKYRLDGCSEALRQQLGLSIETISAVIWTTTPWTLPANRAIAFNELMEYTVVESATHGCLLLATSRVSEISEHCQEKLVSLASFSGRYLIGTTYTSSIPGSLPASRRLLHADFVIEGSGSGLVHVAPGHGSDDYELCLRHKISAFAPVDDKGCFTVHASPDEPERLLGKEVLTDGTHAILDSLSEGGHLIARHEYKHRYPYDWRSKQPVIVRATEQWFANVGHVRKDALHALDSVHFIPPNSKTRLQTFVKNRTEWCISRQRAWGVPIPALYGIENNEPILSESSVSHIIAVIKERGIDAWWTDDEFDPAWTPPAQRKGNGETAYKRGEDTMDVWFDSGTSWTQTQGPSEVNPHVANCYVEGTDQHRGWFQSSLLTHVAYHSDAASTQAPPKAPFETLVTHGFALDQHGRKMSKSDGNVVTPSEIMEGTLLPLTKKKINGKMTEIQDAMGPDALRLWAASCDYTTDVKVSQPMLQAINGSLSKYRVTFKLLLGILEDFDPRMWADGWEPSGKVHQIALWQLQRTVARVGEHYRSLEFNKVVAAINTYISSDLSSFYFDSIKDAAYCGTFAERTQVQATLHVILIHLQQILSPVAPLLIEEIWDYTPQQIKAWDPTPPARRIRAGLNFLKVKDMEERPLASDISLLMKIKSAVKIAQETARNEKKMGDSLQSYVWLEIPDMQKQGKELELDSCFRSYQHHMESIFVVSQVTVGARPPEISEAEWSYHTDLDVQGYKVRVHVYEPKQTKCARCWRYKAPVDEPQEEILCQRCEGVMEDMKARKPELFGDELTRRTCL